MDPSPFLEFCEKFEIKHETSSPYNPKSDGLAEAGVKAMKALLSKLDSKFNSEDFKIALLSWRTTPRADGFSPSYGFFGRHLRTLLPDVRDRHIEELLQSSFHQSRLATAERQAVNAGGVALPPLAVGDRVTVQDPVSKRWMPGSNILGRMDHGRSYVPQSQHGAVLRRNRCFLRLDSTISTDLVETGPEPSDI
ncbi:uncharacterized protein LOC131878051 [Tigriopus californicus]|uniref:uncharacterized protein LOC131878051 n=1 Tax=Tigriopus californicus TaxID=6832 RepID=UPI0027D9E41B|nr:uncharacterized protein LOC131878051 [Tigriopus californicus]